MENPVFRFFVVACVLSAIILVLTVAAGTTFSGPAPTRCVGSAPCPSPTPFPPAEGF